MHACADNDQSALFHFTDVDITNTTAIVVTVAVNTSSVIRFGCRASGVPMVTNIEWNYPPDIVFQQQSPRVTPGNASVTVYGGVTGRIEFKHTGWYICSATNNVTRKSVVFRLMVKGTYELCAYDTCSIRTYVHTIIFA